MALGNNCNIADFNPKRSETAKQLVKPIRQQDDKKDKPIHIRIQSDMLLLFAEIAKAGGKNVSEAVRDYIAAVCQAGHL